MYLVTTVAFMIKENISNLSIEIHNLFKFIILIRSYFPSMIDISF